ncbi:hypothetical protein HanRHA438_Chr13g0605271 [Helianthus annuus]|uniref:Uncharacterized protein n=1 Tax=Helianthus annuus TaxID=4232 RepID=A0A9K3EHS6_HELAN|nr:hypothetical protein HanXRQr2_Chr13g0594511 [Helianthus annuus]KAJ0481815.1 hypothetical protein HanIR_Chr13g0646941 [Helianthus annuus]KAJ0849751.1 hypothetical protein HanPSC8_Chr13g0572551 [Helianthus annuus]KAJ0858801.1 hypothetical protein HanRHA438_Chr13g0605271 [Helianthus annuus]
MSHIQCRQCSPYPPLSPIEDITTTPDYLRKRRFCVIGLGMSRSTTDLLMGEVLELRSNFR